MRVLILFIILFYVVTGHSLVCENIFSSTPKRSYHNSSFELKNAVKTIASLYKFERADLGTELYKVEGSIFKVNSKLDENFRVELLAIHYSVKKASKFIGLSPEIQEHLAYTSVRDTAKTLHLSWTHIQNQIEQVTAPLSLSFRKNLLAAIINIMRLTEVDFSFEIPYLAGYSRKNPAKVYIDKGFQRIRRFLHSDVDLVPFLVVHERMEKALLDTLPISNDRYLIPHQISQRLEKAMVEAAGIPWDFYQNQIMLEEIRRAENPNRIFTITPDDLDYIPYIEVQDFFNLKKLKMSRQPIPRNPLFKIKIVRPGVLHLIFKDQKEMAWTMMRFQEYYESPKFRGKIFTRKRFLNWFARKKDGYASYSEWDGFNIPNEILEIFFQGKFNPLTKNEKILLAALKNFRHEKFYIIATAGRNSPVVDHEIAHSLFYFNPEYKRKALQILAQVDLTAVKDTLRNKIGDYHEVVLIDEVHAWLAHDGKDLTELGLDLAPYHKTIEQLQELYQLYK